MNELMHDEENVIILKSTINFIADTDSLAVYVYLASKPGDWKLSIEEIAAHFVNAGRDKVRRCVNHLCALGLLKRTEIRNEKGRFNENSYSLYISLLNKTK